MELKAFTLGALAASALLVGTVAGHASVTISGTPTTPADHGSATGENDFRNDIEVALGLAPNSATSANFVTSGGISLGTSYELTFTEVGAESGFYNFFNIGGTTLTDNGNFGAPDFATAAGGDTVGSIILESYTKTYGPGAILDLSFTSASAGSVDAPIGASGFGIYYNTADLSSFFLTYDDNGADEDDNHDDYVIRVDVAAIPLPAGILLLGLGLAGMGGASVAQKRRKSA